MVKLPIPFGQLPFHELSYKKESPVHRLPALSAYVTNASSERRQTVRLWAKRDDQAGPLLGWGNKYRKFEYIIPDILAKKASMIVTEGGLQSNHTVQVAGMAKRLGLKSLVLLHRGIGGLRAARDKDAFVRVGNVQLNKLLGAEIRFTDERDTGDEHGPLIPGVLEELKDKGETPYWISSGASLHPLGGLGYARCAFEIAEKESRLQESRLYLGQRLDYVFVACGSGSTLAGLIAGFKLLERLNLDKPHYSQRKIVGILVSRKSRQSQEERILCLARNTGKLIGLQEEDITAEDVHLEDAFVGEAYGILDRATAETIELAARLDGLQLDPVYTGKVMRGMLHWATNHSLERPGPKRNALFIHTGGQNALNAYADVWPQDLR